MSLLIKVAPGSVWGKPDPASEMVEAVTTSGEFARVPCIGETLHIDSIPLPLIVVGVGLVSAPASGEPVASVVCEPSGIYKPAPGETMTLRRIKEMTPPYNQAERATLTVSNFQEMSNATYRACFPGETQGQTDIDEYFAPGFLPVVGSTLEIHPDSDSDDNYSRFEVTGITYRLYLKGDPSIYAPGIYTPEVSVNYLG